MKAKPLDISDMIIIHRGVPWNHELPPCSKKMSHLLEKNESFITWLQPKDGDVNDQIPCIEYQNQMHGLSLRMQKAVWRHVRLKRDWQNVELVSSGKTKLKIPVILLREKLRTQTRFNKMKNSRDNKREGSKQIMSSSSLRRVVSVIEDFVIPMSRQISTLPPLTHFVPKTNIVDDVFKNAVENIEREYPGLTKDKGLFMCSLQRAFDKFSRD